MPLVRTRALLAAFLIALSWSFVIVAPASAQPAASPSATAGAVSAVPVPPATIVRDGMNRATVRAVRLPEAFVIDGRLDEEIYRTIPSAAGFIQQVPLEGVLATEDTELWVFYDDRNLYISAFCHDSAPEREVATELRRDHSGLIQNESLSIVIDTFHDQRNGFTFQTGPLGTLREQAITDGQLNESWNTVWYVRSARNERGWTTEMAIPFKSLRYASSGEQVWGLNVRRIVKWKNEVSFLNPAPAAYGQGAVNRLNVAGTLVGLETPAQSKNLEVKPYVTGTATSDLTGPAAVNDLKPNTGFDFKYGLTRGLMADFTVNTDFAQVEEDLQQVNLTRFSLFFPEKRDFFLEGQGIFGFGGAPLGATNGSDRDIPIMFFSRRIGLNQGRAVPVVAGGRLTGRAGPYSIGAINIQTDKDATAGAAATNFTVMRLKRNVLRRSNVGVIATRRDDGAGDRRAPNLTGGLDANFAFYDNVAFNAFYARTTAAEGIGGSSDSYRLGGEYGADRYGLELERLAVGAAFNPEAGFMRRTDFRRTRGVARFSPRTRRSRLMRKLTWQAGYEQYEDNAGTTVQNRTFNGNFGLEFNSGDFMAIDYQRDHEFVPRAFTISPGVVVPSDEYDYSSLAMRYTLGQQRKVSGRITSTLGSFYGGGTKKEAGYSGYIGLNSHFAFEPSMSLAWVALPFGDFTARVVSVRTIVTPTARMVLSSLMQFNAASHSIASSVRWRWEYRPGSELFVVYTDGRDTMTRGLPDVLNRSFAVKITRLFRY